MSRRLRDADPTEFKGLEREDACTRSAGLGHVYTGQSMLGAMQDGDQLVLEDAPWTDLAVGDVIVFRSPSSERETVHRIRARQGDRLTTRGDRAFHDDPLLVTSVDYIGRVSLVFRGNTRLAMANGRAGRLFAVRSRILRRLRLGVAHALSPIRKLLGDGWWVRAALTLPGVQVVRLKAPGGGTFAKLVWRGKSIARRESSGALWLFPP